MLILIPHNSENQHITFKQTLNALKGEVVFRRIIGNRGQDTLLEDDLSSLFTHGPVGEIWYIPFDKVHLILRHGHLHRKKDMFYVEMRN